MNKLIRHNYVPLIAWVLIGLYIFTFCLISYLKFNSFAYCDFDLAVHSQTIYNIIGGSIFSSILGIDFLGNHFNLILFLISPLALFKSALALLYLQSIMLGIAGWAIYLIAKDALNKVWGLIFVFIYLFYPALGYLNLFEFHPTALAVALMLFMFYFFQKQDYKWFLVFMFLSVMCQENIALVIVFFGIYAAVLKSKPKWWISPILLGIFWFYLTVFIFMPYFNQGKIQFFSLYGYLGNSLPEIFKNILLHPLKITQVLFTKDKFFFLAQLFGPLGFMSLFSPLNLVNLIPTTLQHLLSTRGITEHTIYYHYQAEMVPFIFISAIYGVRNLLKLIEDKRFGATTLMLILPAIVLYYNVTLGPHFKIPQMLRSYQKDAQDFEKDGLLKAIPGSASVVATFEFLPRLSFRKRLYSFHHAYSGRYTLSVQKYKLPDDVEYALIDTDDFLTFHLFYGRDNYQNFINFLSSRKWQVLDYVNSIMLLKKSRQDDFDLYKVTVHPHKVQYKVTDALYDGLKLIGYDLSRAHPKILEIIFYWKSESRIYSNIYYYIDILDAHKQPVFRYIYPIAYGIYPTYAWKKSEYVIEKKRILLPSLPKGKYSLELGFWDCRKRGGLTLFSKIDTVKPLPLSEIVID